MEQIYICRIILNWGVYFPLDEGVNCFCLVSQMREIFQTYPAYSLDASQGSDVQTVLGSSMVCKKFSGDFQWEDQQRNIPERLLHQSPFEHPLLQYYDCRTALAGFSTHHPLEGRNLKWCAFSIWVGSLHDLELRTIWVQSHIGSNTPHKQMVLERVRGQWPQPQLPTNPLFWVPSSPEVSLEGGEGKGHFWLWYPLKGAPHRNPTSA